MTNTEIIDKFSHDIFLMFRNKSMSGLYSFSSDTLNSIKKDIDDLATKIKKDLA